MKKYSTKELKEIASLVRQDIITMINTAGSGHPGGSLGVTDILTVLYFSTLKHIPSKPNLPSRDRLILSHGHVCPALYSVLSRSGYFPLVKLKTIRKLGSKLQGHPHNLSLDGIETSSGPLGQGISQAVGMALAAKMDNRKHHIFCITSDGEHNEGQLWEALMSAGKYRLNNLINIIDRNNIQIDGYTKKIMPLEKLKEKYLSFNWKVLEVDGHDIPKIISVLNKAKKVKNKPVAIITHTIPGKGVKFMENKYHWHGKSPNTVETQKALQQLRELN